MNITTIYYNERKIFFIPNDEGFKELPDDYSLLSMSKTPLDIFDDFLAFLNRNDSTQLVYMNPSVQKTLKAFASNFKQIEAAGGLIQNSKGNYLFIFRNGKWDLPKGKIEENETARKAAIRECEEECGVTQLKITKTLAPSYHIYKLKGEFIFKKTHWFEMTSEHEAQLIPQQEEAITEVIWARKTDYPKIKKNTYPSVLDVMKEIQDL